MFISSLGIVYAQWYFANRIYHFKDLPWLMLLLLFNNKKSLPLRNLKRKRDVGRRMYGAVRVSSGSSRVCSCFVWPGASKDIFNRHNALTSYDSAKLNFQPEWRRSWSDKGFEWSSVNHWKHGSAVTLAPIHSRGCQISFKNWHY